MTLTPFTLVEMRGMSLLTATWFMFMLTGLSVIVYWVLREFGGVWKKLDKHSDSIIEIRQDMSTMRENVAVTRCVVERIDKKLDKEE